MLQKKKDLLKRVEQYERLTKALQKEAFLYPSLGLALNQLQKDIKVCKSVLGSYDKSLNKIPKLLRASDKLQIGGGSRYLDGFVNLDLFPPADIIWDCRYGLPFPEGSFSFVFTEHFFEHVDFPVSAERVLTEIFKTLKPGGRLFLALPDGGKVIEAHVKNDKAFLRKLYKDCYSRRVPPVKIYGSIDLVNYLFRDQLENPTYAVHYWGYDRASLTAMLKAAGFRSVKAAEYDKKLCNPKRKFYTLYLEATK